MTESAVGPGAPVSLPVSTYIRAVGSGRYRLRIGIMNERVVVTVLKTQGNLILQASNPRHSNQQLLLSLLHVECQLP